MNITNTLRPLIEQAFRENKLEDFPIILQATKNPQFGDYQINGVMGAAKKTQQNPRNLAQLIIQAIPKNEIIDTLEIAGPGFINIKLAGKFLNNKVNQALQEIDFGIPKILKNDKVVIDYSSPNLAKEMHVGHLRSTIIGDSLNRIYQFMGATVIPQNHVGDWGTQFGMLIAYLIATQNTNNQDLLLADLEEFYRQAKQKFDEDSVFTEKSREYVVRLQKGDPEILAYWHQFVKVSIDHMQNIYQRLGVLLQTKDIQGESKYNDLLLPVVDELLQKNIAFVNEGTTLVYLDDLTDEEGKPAAYIIRKKDGGFLYSTTDLACIKQNITSLKPTKILYVVDSRQALHFKALFEIATKAGWLTNDIQAKFIAFGTMMDQSGKPFKTRSGGTVKLNDLLDEAIRKAERIVAEKNPDFTQSKITEIAKEVGIGAIKYGDLSKNRLSDYVFNWDNMLSFEGNTAPYLQYAYTRVQSLLAKANLDNEKLDVDYQYQEVAERHLAVVLLQFEEVLIQVIHTNNPHILTNYLYQVATLFSRFYESCDILKAPQVSKFGRLGLAMLTGRILGKGLSLLGINVLNQM